MSRLLAFLAKWEAWITFLVTAIFALLFFKHHYFISLDGSAHLYNANLMYHKIAGGFPLADAYYEWNHLPVPNWTGHILLTILNAFLPASDAEKVLLALMLFFMVYAFRYVLKALGNPHGWMAILIVPFAFNTFLYYGFYNFCIGLSVVFWFVGFMFSRQEKLNWKTFSGYAGLLLLAYFSHLSAFILIGLFMCIWWPLTFIQSEKSNRFKLLFFMVAAMPSLALFVWYYFSGGKGDALQYIDTKMIIRYFHHVYPLITYGSEEERYTTKFFYLFGLMIVAILVYRVYKKNWWEKSDVLLLLSGIAFVLAFVLPDSDGKGGFMTLRLVLYVYLFALAWLMLQRGFEKAAPFLLVVFLFLGVRHFEMRDNTQRVLSEMSTEIYHAGKQIKTDNTLLLPIWRPASWDWITAHHANIIGGDQKVLILENYETPQAYFPLKYKEGHPEPIVLSTGPDFMCGTFLQEWKAQTQFAEYVLEYGTDLNMEYPCEKDLDTLLHHHYKIVEEGKYIRLYQRNSKP